MPKTILELTEDLMRIKSTADRPDELQRAAAVVVRYFSDVPEVFVRCYESDGKPSVVVSLVETLEPDIMLVGHLDVVPAADELFEPRREGELLFGRGSCDMKSEVAIMMQLMREFAALSIEQRPSIALMLGCDEEVGGTHGVGFLLNTIGYRCRVAFVPDGGESPDKVVLKSKGVLHVSMRSRGRAAHGSRPWQGDNAIEKLFDAYKKIHALFPVSDDPHNWYSTCVLGKFTGGIMVNQVPDHAVCEIDIRFVEAVQPFAVLERVRACVGDEAVVELLGCGGSTAMDWNNPFLSAYSEAVVNTLDTELTEEITHGATDGRFFSELGIPVIISRPISGGQHTPDEWVNMNNLDVFLRLYRDAIARISARR